MPRPNGTPTVGEAVRTVLEEAQKEGFYLLTSEVHKRRQIVQGLTPEAGGSGATVAVLQFFASRGEVDSVRTRKGATAWGLIKSPRA